MSINRTNIPGIVIKYEVLTHTHDNTCDSKNSIEKGKVLLYKQVEDKDNADSLGHVEKSMLKRVKHDQNCSETDDVVDNMITS